MHARAIAKATELVPKSARDDLDENFKNYAKAFQDAIDAKSRAWLLSLCNLAKRKAEMIESTALATRRAHWKQVIGITVENGCTRAPRPTKAAYRYARGTDGWATSPVGNSALNDKVDGEPSGTTGTESEDAGTFDDVTPFVPNDTGILMAPLCDQANVDKQAIDWAALWETEKVYVNPLFNLQMDMFEDMAAELTRLRPLRSRLTRVLATTTLRRDRWQDFRLML